MRLRLCAVATLTAAACAFTACQKAEMHERPLTAVRIQTVELLKISGESKYSASVTPETQVPVSFRVGGYIESLLHVGAREVQEGDIVAKDTVLARLRQSDYSTKINQAKAQLAQAEAG